MCTSVPARVLGVDGRSADLMSLGRQVRAVVATERPVQAGDWVLVQAGLVLEVLDEREARDMEKALEEWMALAEGGSDVGTNGGGAS